jgi:transposase
MPKKINYTLTTEQLQTIETAIKNHPNLRVRQRAQMIRLLHLGHKPQKVGELLSVTGSLVYHWHARWRAGGLKGLEDQPKPGRPKIGGDVYRKRLAEIIEIDPHTLGYGFNVWTTKRLILHMEKETAVLVHKNTMINMLDELDYVFRRPKHDLGNLQDKAAKETAAEILEDLKKKPKQAKSNYSLWTKRP